MVSKKKIKGKARKAAKAAKEQAEQDRDNSLQVVQLEIPLPCMQINGTVCLHGYHPPTGADDRIVREFIQAYLEEYNDEDKWDRNLKTALKGSFETTFEKYAAVWTNLEKLEWVISCILFVATKHVLNGNMSQACINVCVGNFFEQHVAVTFRHSQPTIEEAKMLELSNADSHTLVSYLRKRIPCSCLDKKYKEVKHIKKTGECCSPYCPDARVERSKMLVCTRCRRAFYCSRECQKAAWQIHKANCERNAAIQANFDAEKKK